MIGGAAYDAAGSPLPDATVAACKSSAGILLGAVGGPKWADIPVQHRPEQGLLAIRKALGLFANLRPVTTVPELAAASPLKAEKLKGVDILVIRELTGGIYFGKRGRTAQSAVRHLRIHHCRNRARVSRRRQARDGASAQGHVGRQGQRARHVAVVA